MTAIMIIAIILYRRSLKIDVADSNEPSVQKISSEEEKEKISLDTPEVTKEDDTVEEDPFTLMAQQQALFLEKYKENIENKQESTEELTEEIEDSIEESTEKQESSVKTPDQTQEAVENVEPEKEAAIEPETQEEPVKVENPAIHVDAALDEESNSSSQSDASLELDHTIMFPEISEEDRLLIAQRRRNRGGVTERLRLNDN